MRLLQLDISRQPDETTCGPTSLHAVYNYYGDVTELPTIIREIQSLSQGGTLAVLLALHALKRGYQSTIYTYNLHVFDPSWFQEPRPDLRVKLREQGLVKSNERMNLATPAYLEYLEKGGKVVFRPLSRSLLISLLALGKPILTGLSATYLYQEPREIPATCKPDDVNGEPCGHFVVLCGYDPLNETVQIADPLHPNNLAPTRHYAVHIDHVIGAILLGVITYDANLTILEPNPPAA
ncbi:MAG: hypothetical protein SF069_17820 [Phycisphaerae bacterium]|nr:hypothetical protein [Phycisphaerae bacterium]